MAAVWKLLVLIAVLLMPLGMAPATAAVAHHHTAAGMPMGDCPGQAPRHDMKGGIAECTMACASTLPAADVAAHEPLTIAGEPDHHEVGQRLHGLHPDTATPLRSAPETSKPCKSILRRTEMITLVVAAALAAQSPAAPAADAQHAQHMQMGQAAEHKDKDCCQDGCKCCKDMANKHEGHAERGGHAG